jgi:quercetin dioxygenase-like cupin family protein
LPAGVKMAVLEGNPAEEGLFTIRLSTPAGYKIAPHWHPAYEHLTVISGEAKMSLGDTCDASQAHKLGPGAFGWMKPGTHHCFVTEVESVVQVHAFGPWQLYYVNPADDPRHAARK